MRILALTTLYPNPQRPGKGLFVRNRLQAAGRLAQVRIVVPVASTDVKRRAGWSPESGSWLTAAGESAPVAYFRWRTIRGLGSVGPRLLRLQAGGFLERTIREFEPDVLDAEFGYPDGPLVAALARRTGLPYCITLRGSEVQHAEIGSRRKELSAAFAGAAGVVAVSRRLRDFAVSLGARPGAAHWIPNGVDENAFRLGDSQLHRRDWEIPEGTKLLVMAGNLVRLKGFHRGLGVLKHLAEKGVPVQMKIAGPGGFDNAYEEELRQLARSLGIQDLVSFCGPLDHARLATLFSAADLFLLASDREGWPNVVHEAMACGTPVVAADVGAIPDLIPGPEFGIIVEPGNTNALAQASEAALARPWNREAIAAAAGSRSWTNVAQELVAVWQSVAAG
jgi:teichuronic acid biosynthesis glycosyltransferase TuaC